MSLVEKYRQKRKEKLQVKEKEIDGQVEKALDEKHNIADRQLFFCSHCGCKEVDVDFVSDEEDYLCECPNCGELWTYSKDKFEKEVRRQNRVLVKAKRWWSWHNGNRLHQLSIIMDYIAEFLGFMVSAFGFVIFCVCVGSIL